MKRSILRPFDVATHHESYEVRSRQSIRGRGRDKFTVAKDGDPHAQPQHLVQPMADEEQPGPSARQPAHGLVQGRGLSLRACTASARAIATI